MVGHPGVYCVVAVRGRTCWVKRVDGAPTLPEGTTVRFTTASEAVIDPLSSDGRSLNIATGSTSEVTISSDDGQQRRSVGGQTTWALVRDAAPSDLHPTIDTIERIVPSPVNALYLPTVGALPKGCTPAHLQRLKSVIADTQRSAQAQSASRVHELRAFIDELYGGIANHVRRRVDAAVRLESLGQDQAEARWAAALLHPAGTEGSDAESISSARNLLRSSLRGLPRTTPAALRATILSTLGVVDPDAPARWRMLAEDHTRLRTAEVNPRVLRAAIEAVAVDAPARAEGLREAYGLAPPMTTAELEALCARSAPPACPPADARTDDLMGPEPGLRAARSSRKRRSARTHIDTSVLDRILEGPSI